MTEFQILYLHSELVARLWTIVIWWASVSFGLLALAHFASEKLNLLSLIFLVILYVTVSVFVFNIQSIIFSTQATMFAELRSLNSAGKLSLIGQQAMQGTGKITYILHYSAQLGTFIGCIAYLVYSFKKTHRG